jgi:serine/threonine protein kinase
VALLHALGFAHRDIKPANVFISAAPPTAGGPSCDALELKVGDFGFARSSEKVSAGGTTRVVTRYYRAPELLAHSRASRQAAYDPRAVDSWSVGCVLAELAQAYAPAEAWARARQLPALAKGEEPEKLRARRLKHATETLQLGAEHAAAAVALRRALDRTNSERGCLFPGKTSLNSHVGSSGAEDQLAVIGETLAALGEGGDAGWRARFPGAPAELLGLLRALLQPDPAARATVAGALANPWFDCVRGPADAAELASAGAQGGAAARDWEESTAAADDVSVRAKLMELISRDR